MKTVQCAQVSYFVNVHAVVTGTPLTLHVLTDSSFRLDTIDLAWSIMYIYIRGLQVINCK